MWEPLHSLYQPSRIPQPYVFPPNSNTCLLTSSHQPPWSNNDATLASQILPRPLSLNHGSSLLSFLLWTRILRSSRPPNTYLGKGQSDPSLGTAHFPDAPPTGPLDANRLSANTSSRVKTASTPYLELLDSFLPGPICIWYHSRLTPFSGQLSDRQSFPLSSCPSFLSKPQPHPSSSVPAFKGLPRPLSYALYSYNDDAALDFVQNDQQQINCDLGYSTNHTRGPRPTAPA